MVLNKKYQKIIEDGLLRECDINADNLENDLLNTENEMLFDSVCLDKSYQHKKLSGIIMKSMYDTLSLLSSKNIKIGSVWGSIWSEDGKRFFEKLGAVHHIKNKYNGEIYKVPLSVFLERLKNVSESFKAL